MKIIKLLSVGVVLLTVVAIVVGIMAGQLTSVHAAGLTAGKVLTSKDATPQSSPSLPQGIPSQMQVPAGNVLLAQIFGRGVLAFACPATAQSAEVPMIVTSRNANGTQVIGTHFMDYTGLAWEGLNGDKVIAAPLVKAVINPNTAPAVLLQATAHSGVGLFARVTFIIRLPIMGGLPHPCNNPGNQAEIQVPFTTQYLLFGPPAAASSSHF